MLKVLPMLFVRSVPVPSDSFAHLSLPPPSCVIQLSVCILWLDQLRGQVNGSFSELWVGQQLEKMTSCFVWEARKRNLTIKFTHTHTHTRIQARSYLSFPVKLGWWGQPSSYSLHLADRLITAELVETLAWKSSRPTPSSPLSRSPRCLSNTDATVHSNHWFLRGQHPLIHFWVTENTWASRRKLIFCPTTMFPAVRFSAFFQCSDT